MRTARGGYMQKSKNYIKVLLIAGALMLGGLILASQSAMAQANRATITGTVTDSSGAMVVGVDVIATNTGTGEQTRAISNQDGIYVIPNLFPASYSVEFKKTGFESLRNPSITLE